MRMGPGKHLEGLTLMNGLIKPEEVIGTVACSSRPNQSAYSMTTSTSLLLLKRLRDVAHEATETVSDTDALDTICYTFPGLLGGKVIGLPPVLNFGSEELKARVVPEVLSGKKFICLAISEAQAGSDVMGLQTTAVKSEDGKEWIINGTKKWITNAA